MTAHTRPFGAADGLRYGLLGLPLAFVALPLYVVVPHHYASAFGIPLGLLGAVLLGARLLDALVDPLIGRGIDRLHTHSARAVLAVGGAAACLLALGFYLLFFPPVREHFAVMVWLGATLAVTYLAFSVLTVAHQSWGAMLGGDEAQRARIVGWREGLGVVGVLVASVAPATLGLPATTALFAVLLVVGWLAWARSLQPHAHATASEASALWLPLRRPAFRQLLAVFMLNGIASAVPATLVLFFVQDRLQAPRSWEPAFLGLYFLCAALSIPLWLRLVRRWGLARSWLAGMGLAIAAFVWTAGLGAGDAPIFLLVCAASGLTLGADLALPGALLAGQIHDAGDRGRHEGAYFGWWNFATKLNLALAAGLALPLLGLAGYAPGARDAQALSALTFAYGVLPCALKLLAAAGLYLTLIRPSTPTPKATP
ncbi:MAG: putative Na+/melibiose symporter [Pseudomonadota bacterium]|jgi:Na+/melibiose symporter-like transporter